MATLAERMDAAGLAGPENELLKAQYIEALKRRNTKQPEAMQTRDMTVAASPLNNIASTWKQVLGGMDSTSLMQAMSGNLRKQQDFRTAGVDAATQPGADPAKMQYAFAGGGEQGLSGVANAEENRQLKQALLKQQNDARQRQIETTGNFKLTSDMLKEQGLDSRFKPYQGSGTPLSGTVMRNLRDGTQTTTAPVANPSAIGKGEEKAIDKVREYGLKLDATRASARSQFGSNANTQGRGVRALTLINSIPDGNLIPQEMMELTASLAGILTGTNAPALRTMEELLPKTAGRNIAQVKQWLTGNPTGTDQQAFVRRWAKTIQREMDATGELIHKSNLDIFPGYAAYLREAAKDPATKKSIDELHKRHGMDKFIDLDTMSFKSQEAASPPPSGAVEPTVEEIMKLYQRK